jgi:hypothetical protein
MKNVLIIFFSMLGLFILSCSDASVTKPEEKIVYPRERAISNGDNWRLVYTLPTNIEEISLRLTDISVNNSAELFVSTSCGGVYKIIISDSTDKQLISGLISTSVDNHTIHYVGSVLCNGNRTIVGSSNLLDNGGIFITEKENSFLSTIIWNKYTNVVSLYKNPNGEIYAGCYNDILQSKDNGSSWLSLASDTEDGYGYFYSFSFDKYGNIYGATRRGVYYSDSRTISFKNIGLLNEVILCIDINKNEWIFASTENGKMFYSEDNGINWKQLTNYPNKHAHSLYINENNYIIAGTEDGIYRSKDNGITWELIGLKNKYIIRIIDDLMGNLIAGTGMNEIYYSSY